MSQVVVTNDRLKAKREASRLEEQEIDKNSMFDAWRKSDISKNNPALKLLGLAALPLVALWSILLAGMSLGLWIFILILKFCGKIVGSRS